MMALIRLGEQFYLAKCTVFFHAIFQPPTPKKPIAVAVGKPALFVDDLLNLGYGPPEVWLDSRQQTAETGWSHSDDTEVRAIQQQTLSDDIGIRSEALLPESMT